jgi:UDP-glucose 4-epimerase
MNKKILVIGGAGFIGSHLCEQLLRTNKEIISLDNYSTGRIENHIHGVKYVSGESWQINEKLNDNFEKIYHLGEYSRVEQSFTEMDKVWKSNVMGTYEVIKYALKKNAKLIYAGSSTKYGDNGIGRMQSPYGWTKASNTDLITAFSEWYSLNYATTYFYNAYGDREISNGRYATLIGIYRENMREKTTLKIVKPGTQKRNFTHVNDIVSGIILVGEKGIGDGYGLGSSEAYSIEEVAKMFGGPIEYIEERKGNRMNAELHTNQANSIGWEVKYSLKQYIHELKSRNWSADK